MSLASTREATGDRKRQSIFAEDEDIDEIHQLRKRKEDKKKRELQSMDEIRQHAQQIAAHVLPPADPDGLIFEMHWGFPPRPRSPGLVPYSLNAKKTKIAGSEVL